MVFGVHLLRKLRPHKWAKSESIPPGLDGLAYGVWLGEEVAPKKVYIGVAHGLNTPIVRWWNWAPNTKLYILKIATSFMGSFLRMLHHSITAQIRAYAYRGTRHFRRCTSRETFIIQRGHDCVAARHLHVSTIAQRGPNVYPSTKRLLVDEHLRNKDRDPISYESWYESNSLCLTLCMEHEKSISKLVLGKTCVWSTGQHLAPSTCRHSMVYQ